LERKRTGIIRLKTTCEDVRTLRQTAMGEKMTTLFMQLDVNKSGYVTKDDWLRLAYRVAEKNGNDIQRNPKGDRFIPSSIT